MTGEEDIRVTEQPEKVEMVLVEEDYV